MIVYILKDPSDYIVRYIGISKHTAKYRFRMHKKDAKTKQRRGEYLSQKDKWILGLCEQGLEPIIETVFEGLIEKEALTKEAELIGKYKRIPEGGTLYNVQESGFAYDCCKATVWNKGIKDCYSKEFLENNIIAQPNRKTVYRFNKNGSLIDEWVSIRTMCDTLNLDRRAVMRCLKGELHFVSHKGFMFNYTKEPPKYINKSTLNTGPRAHYRRKVEGEKGDKIDQFESIQEAAASLGLNPGCINAVLSGRYKTTGGYTWKYL